MSGEKRDRTPWNADGNHHRGILSRTVVNPTSSLWTSRPEVQSRSGIAADEKRRCETNFIYLGNDIWPFDGNDR